MKRLLRWMCQKSGHLIGGGPLLQLGQLLLDDIPVQNSADLKGVSFAL